jgi:catechol 2,3-dioxygenase-like lactoylglutathione lyase family enzyme
MEHAARITSSVIFVSDIERSVDFYREVFGCEVTIQKPEAALLLASGGFQIYLIGRSARTPHPSGGIGPQYLIWAVNSADHLRDLDRALRRYGRLTHGYTSGGVTFIAGRDPDGIRILMAHPGPDELPRSVIGAQLYV